MINRAINGALKAWMLLYLVFLYIPILALVYFSFADSRLLTFPGEGLTFRWYGELIQNRDFLPALGASFVVALVTMAIATVLGTCGAIAWMRYRFRLKTAFQVLSFLPMLFPQLLLGVMMLLWFSVLGNMFDFSMGLVTLVIGHVVYASPFVLIIVAVQLYGFDESIEDAARDAGASGWVVLRRVTLPVLWPGISSGMIMAFLLSWGNFYLSYSLNGTARTLPIFIYSGIAVGSSPVYPALATLNFIPALALIILADVMRRKAARRNQAPQLSKA